MVYAQTQEEAVLADVNTVKGITQMLLSRKTDQERMAIAGMINSMGRNAASATVSYVGKANYKEAEQYIRDFRTWTATGTSELIIEVSAVNGRFTLDFLQSFSSPVYVNAFLGELEENGIVYDLQDVQALDIPNIRLPWTECHRD
jgi:hypothetical protein